MDVMARLILTGLTFSQKFNVDRKNKLTIFLRYVRVWKSVVIRLGLGRVLTIIGETYLPDSGTLYSQKSVVVVVSDSSCM